MGIIKDIKNKKILNEINKLNGNKLQIFGCVEGIYRASLNVNYEKIKLPNGIKSTIHLYNNDNTLQIFFTNENNEKFAVVECLKTEKMLEEHKKQEEIRKKEAELAEEKRLLEQKEVERKRKAMKELNDRIAQRRFESYIDFLITNGANKEIIELEPVRKLIMGIIKNGDPRVIMDGRSPIVYKTPNVYLAKTEAVRKVGYDPNIRMIDHYEFFLRAAGEIVCVQDPHSYVLHCHNLFEEKMYRMYRRDYGEDVAYIARKHGLV